MGCFLFCWSPCGLLSYEHGVALAEYLSLFAHCHVTNHHTNKAIALDVGDGLIPGYDQMMCRLWCVVGFPSHTLPSFTLLCLTLNYFGLLWFALVCFALVWFTLLCFGLTSC